MKSANVNEVIQHMIAGNDAASAYIQASPAWVQVWVLVMTAVLLPSFVLAFWKREARFVAWSLLLVAVWTPILMHAFGPSRLWGLTHLSFWTPAFCMTVAAIYSNGISGWYQKWLAAASAVMGVSLVFDLIDVIRFAMGEV